MPVHEPGEVAFQVQPGVALQYVAFVWEAQLSTLGVPAQCGPIEKNWVGGGTRIRADLQHSCPGQSLLVSQVLAHVVLQMPLQQISPLAEQSVALVHDLGHGVVVGFRHRPSTFRDGSIVPMVWQHISLFAVSQSDELEQAAGQRWGGRQMGSL
jgi:hypothetical protein